MPFVNPDKTYGEQADRVLLLYQRMCDVRDKHSLADLDSRRIALNNAAMAANASVSTLRLLDWARQSGDATLVAALRLARPEFVNLVAEDLLRAGRLHLLLECQFQIESLFRNLLMALGRGRGKQGYYNLAQEVVAASGVADPDSKLRILNVPALMRNSMHANGIHHGYKGASAHETIDGVEFRFDDGKRVQCGSWLHVTAALNATLSIVDEVLSVASIRAIPLIPDEYVTQKAAAGE